MVFTPYETDVENVEEFNFNSVTASAPLPTEKPIYLVEEVKGNIILVGKGYKNNAGEAVGLACVTDLCNEIRTLYYNPARNKSYFFGAPIFVTEAGKNATQKEIKESISNLSLPKKGINIRARGVLGWANPLTSVLGGLAITLATGGTALVWIGSGLAISAIEAKIFSGKRSVLNKRQLARLTNTDGWSWAENAKRLKYKKFEDLFNLTVPPFGKGVCFKEGGTPSRYFESANAKYQDIYEYRRSSEAPLEQGAGIDLRSMHRAL